MKWMQEYSEQSVQSRFEKALLYWESEVTKDLPQALREGKPGMSKLVAKTIEIAAGIETTKE